jgi:protein-tyrosine phosphatase
MVQNSNLSLVQIQDIYPSLHSHITLYMLENFGATVKLLSPHPPQDLIVQIWTNALTKFNSEGDWHSINLIYTPEESQQVSVFQGSFMPTAPGDFQFTYRFCRKNDENTWQWAGQFQENGYLKVELPSPDRQWTQGPNFVEVFPNIYVGNFIAASQAASLGIDAVLNLGEELTLMFPESSPIAYRKMGTLDGASNPIADQILLAAVHWIDEQVNQDKKKILINCRAGIGRSGSVGVAYCFSKNPQWTYQQTLDYIWSKKPNIYPHSQLQDSLERLFPRSTSR